MPSTIDDLLGLTPAQSAAEDRRLQDNLKVLRREMEETGRSIRRGASPSTVLHALLLQDDQTIGQIAAATHRDPRDLHLAIDSLVALSLVRVDATRHLSRYSLASQLDG